jgi:predicted acyltransferase
MTDPANYPLKKRIRSIDALRGFDMFWIIGGDALFPALFALSSIPFLSETLAHQLDHSRWNGFTFYDLIFPLFLFIVGLTMPFSFGKRKERGDSKKGLMKHVATRTLLLSRLLSLALIPSRSMLFRVFSIFQS